MNGTGIDTREENKAMGWKGDKEGHAIAARKGWAKRLGLSEQWYTSWLKIKQGNKERTQEARAKLREYKEKRKRYNTPQSHTYYEPLIARQQEEIKKAKQTLKGSLELLKAYTRDERRKAEDERRRKQIQREVLAGQAAAYKHRYG